MLDFDKALELMNKYGYTSISVHPFIYQNGDTIGICYTYVDEEFGLLERIKIFENEEEFEEFLKKLNWVQTNGKVHHVRMILDNYESINPKVMYLRNEKVMVEGEMFDIENYDAREAMRADMDDVSKIIFECGDLLLFYNENKSRQMQYLKNLVNLKNTLRNKYFELQKEVDIYNKVKVERVLKLVPEVTDIGINEAMEIATKDRYNLYVSQRPTYDEAVDFLKEVWELNLNLELNLKYYEAQKEENDIRNEIKVVDQKLVLMKSLNEELKPLFGVDLVSKFRKINKSCKDVSSSISEQSILSKIDAVHRKYSFFPELDFYYTSDYLREAVQNSNYKDLAKKYAKGKSVGILSKYKTPLNEVAGSLSLQYRDNLSSDEQAILVLYNNKKVRALCDVILEIENFETVPIKQIVKKLNGIKGLSKIKSECYDSVKKRIDLPENGAIKATLFNNYNFSTFETFIDSLVRDLVKLKKLSGKLVLNGDINMYLCVDKVDELTKKKYVMVTNDLVRLQSLVQDSKSMIGITLLKKDIPVFYSPYYFDLGNIYAKDVVAPMEIKEMVNFEILINIEDLSVMVDPNKTNVAKYYTEPNIVDNLSIVDDIKMSTKTTFCKYVIMNVIDTLDEEFEVEKEVPTIESIVHGDETFDNSDMGSVAELTKEEVTNSGFTFDEPQIDSVVAFPITDIQSTEMNVSKVEDSANTDVHEEVVENYVETSDVNIENDDIKLESNIDNELDDNFENESMDMTLDTNLENKAIVNVEKVEVDEVVPSNDQIVDNNQLDHEMVINLDEINESQNTKELEDSDNEFDTNINEEFVSFDNISNLNIINIPLEQKETEIIEEAEINDDVKVDNAFDDYEIVQDEINNELDEVNYEETDNDENNENDVKVDESEQPEIQEKSINEISIDLNIPQFDVSDEISEDNSEVVVEEKEQDSADNFENVNVSEEVVEVSNDVEIKEGIVENNENANIVGLINEEVDNNDESFNIENDVEYPKVELPIVEETESIEEKGLEKSASELNIDNTEVQNKEVTHDKVDEISKPLDVKKKQTSIQFELPKRRLIEDALQLMSEGVEKSYKDNDDKE